MSTYAIPTTTLILRCVSDRLLVVVGLDKEDEEVADYIQAAIEQLLTQLGTTSVHFPNELHPI